ncbi:DUF3152 domain-containing protein [Streptomyces sp. NBC_01237]|uniref:DUF3152 domain-containing protein n=1 Tax=Streptomyces sp. NBC_01237 TaxID=2903790 RepID=UPI002DD9BC09|nr:DUF3152 domain-containing protein [Streptomyces sp. NBC_01237]
MVAEQGGRRTRRAAGQGRGTGRGRRTRREARRARTRIRVLGATAVPAVLVALALLTGPWGGEAKSPAAAGASAGSGPADSADSADSAKPATTPKPPPAVSPTADADDTAEPPAGSVPRSASGRFTVARPVGGTQGKGEVHHYRVEVERGSGLTAGPAAAEISEIFGDPRGWTGPGDDAFRQISSGPAGLVIRIATPDTVDKLCGAYGLRTRGEVNCRIGTTVVVNLKRWIKGSPRFDGPIHDYRALIINHEVGHWLGHGHEPVRGRDAGPPR